MYVKKLLSNLRFIDRKVATDFLSMIANDLDYNAKVMIEINPGYGYLTEELLSAGVSSLHLYEKDQEYTTTLTSLVKQYPERLIFEPYNFLTCVNDHISNSSNYTRIENIFQHYDKNKCYNELSMCVIGVVPEKNFFYNLQDTIIYQNLLNYGHMALCVAILPSVSLVFHNTLNKPGLHKAKNICLQLLFDYKFLGSLPRTSFLPLPRKKKLKKRYPQYYTEDNDIMHIVKLNTKSDFITDNFTYGDASLFYCFLALNLKSTKLRVIPELEKWVPNCGPRLIRLDFNIFTKFTELSALELLNLFKAFKSWPEYKSCIFFSIVDDLFSRRIRQV